MGAQTCTFAMISNRKTDSGSMKRLRVAPCDFGLRPNWPCGTPAPSRWGWTPPTSIGTAWMTLWCWTCSAAITCGAMCRWTGCRPGSISPASGTIGPSSPTTPSFLGVGMGPSLRLGVWPGSVPAIGRGRRYFWMSIWTGMRISSSPTATRWTCSMWMSGPAPRR